MKTVLLALVTGFGLGYSPFAPGTCGTFPGFILVWLFSFLSAPVQALLIVVLFFAGTALTNYCLQWFEEKDPRAVTIDEIVSLPITFFMVPLDPVVLVVGFVLNRILDILKPMPAFQSQELPRGWGIMTDDLISGIYSCLLLHLFVFARSWMGLA